jgi:hypothetical protein
MRLSALFTLLATTLGCTPGYGPDQEGSAWDLPTDETTGEVDWVEEEDSAEEPLNLSFESPAVSGGMSAPPSVWSTDEQGGARTFVYGDPEGASHGNQYVVLAIDDRGRGFLTSPDLAFAEPGVPLEYSFALRSDCPTAVLMANLGDDSAGFALLPTREDWARLSFVVTPEPDQAGAALWLEIVNEASEPCDLELDDVRIR